jgi:hypothetical protein
MDITRRRKRRRKREEKKKKGVGRERLFVIQAYPIYGNGQSFTLC